MIGMNLINKLLLTVRIDYRIDVFQEFFDCSVRPNLSATLATDQKLPLNCLRIPSYQSFSRVRFTIVLIPLLVLTTVNVTLPNFGKRYEDDLTLFGMGGDIFIPLSLLDQIFSADFFSKISKLFWR